MRVVYLGRKPVKGDNVAETHLTWTPGQVHDIPDEKKAAKLLEHPKIWADADKPFEMELEPVLTKRDPQLVLAPDAPKDANWDPIVMTISDSVFQRLQRKELEVIFMTPEDSDQYSAWKMAGASPGPQNTGPAPQPKETKAGLETRKRAA